MTTYNTATSAIPIRIDATHYTMPSLAGKRYGKIYELTFKATTRHWECTCFNYVEQGNHSCKHVRRLREWIAEQESSRVQREANEVVAAVDTEFSYQEFTTATPDTKANKEEIIKVVGSFIDESYAYTRRLMQDRDKAIQELKEILALQCDHITIMKRDRDDLYRIVYQQRDDLKELKKQNAEIYTLLAESREEIEELKKVEPVVIQAQRVVVDAPTSARRRAAKAIEPEEEAEQQIEEIFDLSGKIIACKVGRFRIPVIKEEFTVICPCDKGQSGPCKHSKAVDRFLAARKAAQ